MTEILLKNRVMKKGIVLPKEFYNRPPDQVAKDLLGKVLVRSYEGTLISGIIVEVEAYFGVDDPASRARKGGDLRETLYGPVGKAAVYGIHRQWMLNAVAHSVGEGGAVLFRALEPLEGVEIMKKFRGTDNPKLLLAGPGRLTQALRVGKEFHKKPLYRPRELWIEDRGVEIHESEISRDFRVGVNEDLPEPYRYLIRESPYISRKPRISV